MPRILLIENDPGFAGDLARVLDASGYETQIVGEGKEGLARAAAWRPDAIVLSVELPDMSGYLVCQRLRKDDALRTIPLVLTSADATEKSFADHQKLKVRADAYLLKPYPPQTLLESLAHLAPVPEGATEEEELVRLEDGGLDELPPLGLDDLEDERPRAGHLAEDPRPAAPARDEDDLFLDSLMSLGDEAPPAAGDAPPATDDGLGDLDLPGEAGGLELDLDEELDRSGLGEPGDEPSAQPAGAGREPDGGLGELGDLDGLGDLGGPGGDDRPVEAAELDAAADSLPDDANDPLAALNAFTGDDDAGLGALSDGDEKTQAEPLRPPEEPPRVKPASADLLRAAGIKLLDEDDAPPASAPTPPPARVPGMTLRMPAVKRAALPELDDLDAAGPAAPPPPAPQGGGVAERLERELAETRERLSDSRAEILSRESELRALKDKMAAATRRAEQAEAEVREARTAAGELAELREQAATAERRAEDAAKARAEGERRAAEAERRAAEAERRAAEAAARADAADEAARARAEKDAAAEKDLEALRAELAAAHADAEALKAELARAKSQPAGPVPAALEKRLAELEAANAKNEERVLKAYQKIRGDEKVRDKVRKALAIAAQLLDEGMAPDPGERDRRAPPPPGPKL